MFVDVLEDHLFHENICMSIFCTVKYLMVFVYSLIFILYTSLLRVLGISSDFCVKNIISYLLSVFVLFSR